MTLNNLKNLFISALFLALSFLFVFQIPSVLADCNIAVSVTAGCLTSGNRSNGGLNFSNCDTEVIGMGSSDWFWRVCKSESGKDGQNCYGNTRTEKCIETNTPAAPIGYDGKPCQVNFADAASTRCNNYFGTDWTYWGKWDESEGSCDICNDDFTVAERIFCDYTYCGAAEADCRTNYGGFHIWCESACGASPQCDDGATYSDGVVVPGGTCDFCVFTGLPQCSDGIDNDGDGKIDFPADPGCTDASDDDEADGVPVGCDTGPTYTCPPEITCPVCSKESGLRGGLVPCGRTCDDPCTEICECAPCTLCHFFVLFKRIVDFATLNILFPLAVLMIVVGGVMFLTAGGDPGRIGGAKKILTATVIGLAIILVAWLIVDTVITFITPAGSPFQQWHTINCPVP